LIVFWVITSISPLIAQWVQTTGTGVFVMSLVLSDANIFAGTGSGVLLTTNNGSSWVSVNSGLTRSYVSALAIRDSNLYAGTDRGVFHSTNNGKSWKDVTAGMGISYVFNIFDKKEMKKSFLLSAFVLIICGANAQKWGLYTLYSITGTNKAYLVDTNNNVYKTWTMAANKKTSFSSYLIPGDTLVRTVNYTGNVINNGTISGEVQKVDWNGIAAECVDGKHVKLSGFISAAFPFHRNPGIAQHHIHLGKTVSPVGEVLARNF